VKRILFLFSDTGGGHRSATEAIIEAMSADYPGEFSCNMVDFFRSYYPAPFKYAPEIYQRMAKYPIGWSIPYELSDGKRRTRMAYGLSYPVLRRAMHRLLAENPCDLVVSVHPLPNNTVLRAMRHHPKPLITVVTDMVTTHAFWYERRANVVIVPTEAAKKLALKYGVPEARVRVIGLPVAAKFSTPLLDRSAWRREQGWDESLPTALLVGGGDGMGPLLKVAKALNEASLPMQLAVICGRNEDLKADMEALEWNIPAHIYGFTTQMPAFMGASDMLITKAGPGTISEGFIAGLPLILYSRLPGQEDGNVTYVKENGAGVWAPNAKAVLETVREWVAQPEARAAAAAASKSLAKPDAAKDIAKVIAEQVGVA
jgi:1,2-diacylglycerol 3-beta-galactosyltransferase